MVNGTGPMRLVKNKMTYAAYQEPRKVTQEPSNKSTRCKDEEE